ncbi:MAG: (d)CMP kinase [Bacteroidota bacterium]
MITIAIDGYSACGKSTLARAMAARLGYRYIDTGAMYRAVTLYFIRYGIEFELDQEVQQALENIVIDFHCVAEVNRVLLNGEDVEDEIRGLEVSNLVSPVAAVSAVRRAMVAQQRRMGQAGSVVMDGRDIGTVVFPNAELKIFVTAAMDKRVERRYQELLAAGKDISREEVRANLEERDHIDSTRADSPLKKAVDAILLDNTNLSYEAFIAAGMELAEAVITEEEQGL